MADNVHQPKHYTAGGIETIDYIASSLGREGFRDYCIGNVVKYVSRWRHKNGDEDLRKASVYLLWAINGSPSVKLTTEPQRTAEELAASAGVIPSMVSSAVMLDPERDDDTGEPYPDPRFPPSCSTGGCGDE